MASRLSISFLSLCCLTLLMLAEGQAQNTIVLGNQQWTVYKTPGPGHYEYNKDGVPLLGLIVTQKGDDVDFSLCSNTIIKVKFKELKSTTARCSRGPSDPGPWRSGSKNIEYFFKANSDPSSKVVQLGGKPVDLSTLPTLYTSVLMDAKAGDPVGFTFTGEDGKPSLGFIAKPYQ